MTTLRNRFSIGSLPPEYTPTRGSELDGGGEADIELTSVRTSLTSSPPSYSEAFPSFSTSSSSSTPAFHPTLQLQLSTVGKSWFSNPFPTRPETIPIFSLQQQPGDHDEKLEFISIRPEHGSGSCYLTVPTTPTPGEENDNGSPIQVLSTTRYRFGPGRPPVVRLFSPYSRPLSREVLYRLLYGEKKARDKLSSSSSSSSSAIPHAEGWHEADSGVEIEEQEEEYEEWDTFSIEHPNLLTRATIFRTRLGAFEWRYASRAERKHLAQTLVPQLVDSSSTNPFTNDDEDTTTTVAAAAATATATADSSSSGGGGHNRGHGRWKGKEQEEKDHSKHNKLNNVLILSRLTTIANAQNLSSTSHHPKPPTTTTTLRRPIAYLLRSSSFRTPGSGACYAGNGGRLVIDLSLWNDSAQEDQEEEEEEGRDQITTTTTTTTTTTPRSKLDREMATITIVTTCLVMLKKEVDRRRAYQIAIIAGGGGGGS